MVGHTLGSMLSKLNELTLQKELQNFMTNKVFWTKKTQPQQQQNKKANIKIFSRAGN